MQLIIDTIICPSIRRTLASKLKEIKSIIHATSGHNIQIICFRLIKGSHALHNNINVYVCLLCRLISMLPNGTNPLHLDVEKYSTYLKGIVVMQGNYTT